MPGTAALFNKDDRHSKLKLAFLTLTLALTGTFARAAPLSKAAWVIETHTVDPANYYGEMLGNGMIGIVTAPHPLATGPLFLNGAYEKLSAEEPLAPPCLMTSFDVFGLELSIDGISIDHGQVSGLSQSMDYRSATFTTQFIIPGKAEVATYLRALRSRPSSAMIEVEIRPLRTIEVQASGSLVAPALLREVRHFPLKPNSYHPVHGLHAVATAVGKGPTGELTFGAAQTFLFDEPVGASPALSMTPTGIQFTRRLEAGKRYRFALVGSTLSSAHTTDPLNGAARLTIDAAIESRQKLVQQHERDWAELWKGAIIIDGDPRIQREVNAMLYHLYASIREGSGFSIPRWV